MAPEMALELLNVTPTLPGRCVKETASPASATPLRITLTRNDWAKVPDGSAVCPLPDKSCNSSFTTLSVKFVVCDPHVAFTTVVPPLPATGVKTV
ncbi:MAG: hypothetical protein WCI18_07365 [Pseudomonadota bacterium]